MYKDPNSPDLTQSPEEIISTFQTLMVTPNVGGNLLKKPFFQYLNTLRAQTEAEKLQGDDIPPTPVDPDNPTTAENTQLNQFCRKQIAATAAQENENLRKYMSSDKTAIMLNWLSLAQQFETK